MVSTASLADTETSLRASRRRWWAPTVLLGALLLLVAAGATAATHRDPDPIFLHQWWTPIARTPPACLLLGSLGLDLLLATGITALVVRAVRSRRRIRPLARLLAALLLTALIAVGWSVAASSRASASGSAIVALLSRAEPGAGSTRTGSMSPGSMSPEARKATELALGWPAAPDQARVLSATAVPVGPWILQSTEVLNQGAQDEAGDVTTESLVDPVTGRIDAAWFFGL